jgi:hypothetical protein
LTGSVLAAIQTAEAANCSKPEIKQGEEESKEEHQHAMEGHL